MKNAYLQQNVNLDSLVARSLLTSNNCGDLEPIGGYADLLFYWLRSIILEGISQFFNA